MTKKLSVDDLRYDSETGSFRREDGALFELVHDEERDLWVASGRAEYVQNLSRLAAPFFLRVDGSVWRSRYAGRSICLNWNEIQMPEVPKAEFRRVLIERLRRNAPTVITSARTSLLACVRVAREQNLNLDRSIGKWTAAELAQLMVQTERASAEAGSRLRAFYREMVTLGIPGCSNSRIEALDEIRLSIRKQCLPAVRTWNPTTGALTTPELEVLRRNLLPPDEPETPTEHFARVLLRLLVALGRRPDQLLAVPANGIEPPKHDARLPAVIWVPGAKAQRNEQPLPYDLPEALFDDLMRFAARPEIREAQTTLGFFFVTPLTTQSRARGQRSTDSTVVVLQGWIKRRGTVSPRTGKPLHVTPTRLRHTVATQLARKGWSKEDIQEFLEHRGENAVLAYLDAVGNDMTPALERVDRALGGLFTAVTDVFQGRVIPRPDGKIANPILVPNSKNKAVIGQCGLAGTCTRSPFTACLSGCAHFLFFKDADVEAARAHIRDEHDRWQQAEGNAGRSRAHDDFARVDAGLSEARAKADHVDG